MIEGLFLHTNGVSNDTRNPVDTPWEYNIRSQIFCRNQEEHDYLSSLNLMHGREIQIDIWEKWLTAMRLSKVATQYDKNARILRVLPIAYTTWVINLRGM